MNLIGSGILYCSKCFSVHKARRIQSKILAMFTYKLYGSPSRGKEADVVDDQS